MVLQRDRPIRIWGWADPGEKVEVTFGKHVGKAIAGIDRSWEVILPAMPAGGPHEIHVKGANALKIQDVHVGEVWFCSGQSNMETGVLKSRNHDQEIAAADYPSIRTFTAPTRRSNTPVDDVVAEWKVVSPRSVAYTSAVAYYFGREIHRELKVPVGLVIAAVGGTRIEMWTPAVGIRSVPELQGIDKDENGELYNGMIHPLLPFPVRGTIWYQGEGNVGDGMRYCLRMKALIRGMREIRRDRESPFYYVQLTPLNWGGKPVDQLPEVWEAQTATLSEPNTGMIVTTDIGNTGDAHPRNKQDVGRRLALWALAKAYGRKDLVHSGPLYRDCRVEDSKMIVLFDHAHGGLASRDGKPLSWFSIAGADGRFLPASAEISGDSVIVSSKEVAKPIAVRFAWHQIAEPNLVNGHGLPASPFRTDHRHPLKLTVQP
jgi:sialate O-acetylesterase